VELQNEKQSAAGGANGSRFFTVRIEPVVESGSRQEITLGDSLSFFDTPQPDVNASLTKRWECGRNGKRWIHK